MPAQRRTTANRRAPAKNQEVVSGAVKSTDPSVVAPSVPSSLNREEQARLRRKLVAKFH